MLNWWLGKPAEGQHHAEDGSEPEPPETPAPVFAARALKSAIFGAPPLDDTVIEGEDEEETSHLAKKDIARCPSRASSPIKPQGILLTPGTGTTRRKTVSFGNEVAYKKEEKNAGVKGQGLSRSGIPDDCPGKFPSPWNSSTAGATNSMRKTSLTRQMERARERKNRNGPSESKPLIKVEAESSKDLASESKSEEDQRPTRTESDVKAPRTVRIKQSQNQELMHELIERDGADNDVTTDLNFPHSQSGNFWKSEFDRYHDEAQEQMKSLLKYREQAKSYARVKDSEATNLAQKLRDEQRRVLAMEDRITQLSARIAATSGDSSDDESPELIKQLARQTALAVQYKEQVEQFRSTMEANGAPVSPQKIQDSKRYTSPRTEQTILETRRELKKAKEHIRENASLHEEVDNLRKVLSSTEKQVSKLESGNAKLTQDLLHGDLKLERHLEKCGKKLISTEEQRQRKHEALQTLQKDYDDLKDRSKQQRKDTEQLLRKKHDQCVELKKELASARGSELKIQGLQEALDKMSREHLQSLNESEQIINDLRKELASRPSPKTDKMLPPPKVSFSSDDRPVSRDSLIPKPHKTPNSSQSLSRPSKAALSTRQTRSDTPNYSPARPQRSSLSEIVNNASTDVFPAQKSGPVQHTPAAPNRFSNQSLDLSLDLDLPSPEPSGIFGNNKPSVVPSPRPSRFNFDITSSPPKPAMTRFKTTGELVAYQRSREVVKDIGSSRVGSLNDSRVRKDIPPERAAAAKARLEQKRRERGKWREE